MESLGFDLQSEAMLETLILDVVKSNEIEGLELNPEQVRSSLARRLGLEVPGMVSSDREVDGIVEMMLDATQRFNDTISVDRLFGWHSALFPSGCSGMYKIKVGAWRDDTNGPMQVVSGGMGRESIHFQAPDHSVLDYEMKTLISWVNHTQKIDPVIKAGIAHLWFVTIHPFEDGNGRIARALTDLLLARSDGIPQRFYSMSPQIRKELADYYDVLEMTQKGSLDITYWLDWFLKCLLRSIDHSHQVLEKVLYKHDFLNSHATTAMNERQAKMIGKMLEGFHGKVTTSKWAKICKCSNDTALRDIQDLIAKHILEKELAGGRSTSYVLCGRPD